MLNARKRGKQQASTIQNCPVKNKKSRRQKQEQNEANCTSLLFTCNCNIATDKLFETHKHNFNTQFQLPSFLRAVKYNFNILVNSQNYAMFTRNSNTSIKTMMECKLILMLFTKEAASLHAKGKFT